MRWSLDLFLMSLDLVETFQVTVEGFNGGEAIDLMKLDGTWRLQYTSTPDVVVLFEAASRFPFFQVVLMIKETLF